jgi:pyruvate-formate lyase-activating enzyme
MLDPFGRSIRYLRISVTDRCNLRCTYCRPPGDIEPSFHTRVLSYEELLRVCGIFWRLGFDKFRLTGGEPLVRRDFVPFVSRLRSRLPDAALGCTTNGLLFARYAESLKVAGLDRVNFSLDSLRPSTFRLVTGSDGLERVLEGIDAALAQDFRKVKINVVVMRGVNHGEIPAFVDRFGDRPLYIRFIEFMPYGINNWDATPPYWRIFNPAFVCSPGRARRLAPAGTSTWRARDAAWASSRRSRGPSAQTATVFGLPATANSGPASFQRKRSTFEACFAPGAVTTPSSTPSARPWPPSPRTTISRRTPSRRPTSKGS